MNTRSRKAKGRRLQNQVRETLIERLDIHPEDIKTAVSNTPQLKLYTFSKSKSSWEDIAISGNGEWYKLTNNPTEMYANLMDILSEICKGGTSEN